MQTITKPSMTLKNKRPRKLSKGTIFQYDNIQSYVFQATTELLISF